MLLVLLMAAGWYAYAKIYTQIHGGVVSEVEIRPIWKLNPELLKSTWNSIGERFREGQYHAPWFLVLAGLLIIHNIIFWKKYDRFLSWLLVLVFAGALGFSLLFFRDLRLHDYYQMNNLIVVVIAVINFLWYLKRNLNSLTGSFMVKSFLVASLCFLIISCRSVIETHYYNSWHAWHSHERYNSKYDEITPYLRSLGIERNDPVYCTPDPSINISLYLMDQIGHTDFLRKSKSFGEKVALFSSVGAKYVILGEKDAMAGDPADYGLRKIGEQNGVQIFRIIKP